MGPKDRGPSPRECGMGTSSTVLKALRAESGRKGTRRPQTASDVLETQMAGLLESSEMSD